MLKSLSSSNSASGTHRDRLARLSAKIGEIRVYTETEKTTKTDTIEQRLRLLEDSLTDYQETFSKRLGSIRDNIVSLQKNAEADKKEYDLVISNDIQDLQSFEERLQGAYESIRQKRREHDSNLSQLLDERTGNLTYEIQREQGLLQDEIKQLTQIYDSDMKKLNIGLSQETSEREEGDDKIAEQVERELKRIDDTLNDLKKYADNGEKKIFDTVKNSVTEIKVLLDDEKTEREKTHENMINLLETAMRNFGTDHE